MNRDLLQRLIDAWDSSPLPKASDGMMQERMEEVRAALGAPDVPPGFVLVPVDPTRAMWQAINKVDDAAFCDGQPHGADFESLWVAAIEAAQKA